MTRRDVFQAIADPIRREILDLLSQKNLSVNEVAEHFDITRQAVSKQLKILDECGLVNVTKQGRERYYSIEPKSLIPAFLWIEQYQKQWEERIDSFEDYLQQLKSKKNDR
ncbi:ArsR/SmtB family transcription factor [Portibacter marinus]|uniref:ArsR/SmtB family transcription factor n=1 Tax=Portibacter marinus TaxID=2898660 RepID=UPI001F2D4AFC|nr:metalloregulator ArsR/SmtB family transcription factor [Portibacter marinus]